MPPAVLFGDVFVLRAIEDADWRVEQELSRDPDVVRWTLCPQEMTEAQARAWGRRSQRRVGEGVVQRYVIWTGTFGWGPAPGAPRPGGRPRRGSKGDGPVPSTRETTAAATQ